MSLKTNTVKFNFFMNSILTVSTIVFPLITFPYVSRILLPLGTGKVALATSLVSYFVLIAQLGIPTYGIRACAEVRDDRSELSRVVKELLIINIATSALAYVVYFALLITVPKFSSEQPLYLVMSASILLNAIGIEWLYKGLEEYRYITIRSIAFKLIAIIAMFAFVHQISDYVIYGAISIFAASASNVLNFVKARKLIFTKTGKPLRFRRHLKAVSIFFAMACATTVYTHLDTVMLGLITNDAEVGYYNAAIKIKQFLVSVLTSLGAVLLPRSSYYVSKGDFNKFYDISSKAIRFVLTFGFPLIVFFLLFATQSVLLLSGEEYLPAVLPMQVLIPTVLIIGLSNLLGIQMLVPLGKERVVLKSVIAGAVCDFALNILLIPSLGSLGAAIGTLVAESVVLAVQLIALRETVLKMLVRISYLKVILATVASSFLGLLTYRLEINGILLFFLVASIFFGSYFLAMFLFKEHKNF